MFIHYKGTNVHALGFVNAASMNLNQSPQEVRGLLPGWNEFPKNIWDQNKDHPSIKKMVAKGVISVMSQEVKVKIKDKAGRVKLAKKVVGQDDRPIKIKWFDEKLAIEIVKETWTRDLLQRWLDEENRHKVKRALDKQIKPLLKAAGDDDDDGDDDDAEENWD